MGVPARQLMTKIAGEQGPRGMVVYAERYFRQIYQTQTQLLNITYAPGLFIARTSHPPTKIVSSVLVRRLCDTLALSVAEAACTVPAIVISHIRNVRHAV